MVNGSQVFHGFDFYDYRVLDHKIHAIAAVELYISIDYWQGNLFVDPDTHLAEFEGKTGVVGGFQQSRADSAVDFDGGSYDSAREPI